MNSRLLMAFLFPMSFLSGCFSAKIVDIQNDSCRLISNQYTLNISKQDPIEQSLTSISACIDPACMLYTPLLTGVMIPTGSLVVSGSLVVVGNTVHWLEMQGRCNDSQSQRAMTTLRNATTKVGGMVLHSVDDVRQWLSTLGP
jgi:hypothetical protein